MTLTIIKEIKIMLLQHPYFSFFLFLFLSPFAYFFEGKVEHIGLPYPASLILFFVFLIFEFWVFSRAIHWYLEEKRSWKFQFTDLKGFLSLIPNLIMFLILGIIPPALYDIWMEVPIEQNYDQSLDFGLYFYFIFALIFSQSYFYHIDIFLGKTASYIGSIKQIGSYRYLSFALLYISTLMMLLLDLSFLPKSLPIYILISFLNIIMWLGLIAIYKIRAPNTKL